MGVRGVLGFLGLSRVCLINIGIVIVYLSFSVNFDEGVTPGVTGAFKNSVFVSSEIPGLPGDFCGVDDVFLPGDSSSSSCAVVRVRLREDIEDSPAPFLLD